MLDSNVLRLFYIFFISSYFLFIYFKHIYYFKCNYISLHALFHAFFLLEEDTTKDPHTILNSVLNQSPSIVLVVRVEGVTAHVVYLKQERARDVRNMIL